MSASSRSSSSCSRSPGDDAAAGQHGDVHERDVLDLLPQRALRYVAGFAEDAHARNLVRAWPRARGVRHLRIRRCRVRREIADPRAYRIPSSPSAAATPRTAASTATAYSHRARARAARRRGSGGRRSGRSAPSARRGSSSVDAFTAITDVPPAASHVVDARRHRWRLDHGRALREAQRHRIGARRRAAPRERDRHDAVRRRAAPPAHRRAGAKHAGVGNDGARDRSGRRRASRTACRTARCRRRRAARRGSASARSRTRRARRCGAASPSR